MQVSSPASLPGPAAALPSVHAAGLNLTQLTHLLSEPPAQLLVDCGWQLAPHPLGVCRFVAQLLQLRRRGICIRLCNVHPVLHRCLHHLELGTLFHLSA